MFNKKVLILLTLTAAVAMSGCGKKDAETEKPEQPAAEEETMSEDAEAIEPITPSDYLVKNVSDYITLGSLDDLSATQTAYTVSDEMVQERIQDELYTYSEEKEVEKAAEGNIVYADVTSSVQGAKSAEDESGTEGDEDSDNSESTYFTIGDEDYGEEFDQKLIGASAGDELSFSITYDDDSWYEEWANQTVDFQVSVTGVYETIVPEYDDAFVSEYTDYDTKEDYEAYIRETIQDEYDEESYADTINALFQSAMDECTYNGYPKDLYATCENEVLAYYGQFIGETDPTAIREALELSDDDLKEDVLNTVNLRLLITAICEEHNLELTEDDYVEQLTADAEEYGFMSAAEYESFSGRESIVWSLYENLAAEYLYDRAEITTVEGDAEDLEDVVYLDEDETDLDEYETDFSAAEMVTEEPETIE